MEKEHLHRGTQCGKHGGYNKTQKKPFIVWVGPVPEVPPEVVLSLLAQYSSASRL